MTPGTDVIIDIQDLRTQFGTTVIHEHLNLQVTERQIVALVGGSGSGKTTLLRQMLGLQQPAAGQVHVLGQVPGAVSGAGNAARIGMLFQRGALFSAFSVLENIALPLTEQGGFARELALEAAFVKLQMVGLKSADAWKRPSDLSGGMIKRVALARALAMDPPLLLLDEPTAGLDPMASEEFVELLAQMHRELALTVVMVTHDLDTIFELATHVAVLAEKRVLVMDTPDRVVNYEHPFVQQFFNGARGRRAQAAWPERVANAAGQRS